MVDPHPRLVQTTLFVRVFAPLFLRVLVRACVCLSVCVCCDLSVLRFVCVVLLLLLLLLFFLSSKWLCLWRCLVLLPAAAAPVII